MLLVCPTDLASFYSGHVRRNFYIFEISFNFDQQFRSKCHFSKNFLALVAILFIFVSIKALTPPLRYVW